MKVLPLLSFCLLATACSDVNRTEQIKVIDNLLSSWHNAAANADADAFFSLMTENAVYLGTDPSEKWRRDELRKWSKDAFERESAWTFKAIEREIYLSENAKKAWFDEKLDTWMGTCRGSGILVKLKNGEWKIRHYNLALLLENEKIQDFIDLKGK